MLKSSYDVVVVSARFPALVVAALLAKRGFRVLLVKHDALPPRYEIAGRTLPRGPFNFLPVDAPIARSLFAELAIQQAFRQKATATDVAFQYVDKTTRIDVALDGTWRSSEFGREFPDVAGALELFAHRALEIDRDLDTVLDGNTRLHPRGFFERREAQARVSRLPWAEDPRFDVYAQLSTEHPFRTMRSVVTRFATSMDPDHVGGLAAHRTFSQWMRGGAWLPDGYETLRGLLIDSLRAQRGELLDERIDAIRFERGVVRSVRVASSGEEIGASFLVIGSDIDGLLPLLSDRSLFERTFEEIGEPVVRQYRYVLHLVVGRSAVPEGMRRELFLHRPDATTAGTDALRVQVTPLDDEESLITIEALLPRRSVEEHEGFFDDLRERLIDSLELVMPFVREHLRFVDSPHDGRPGVEHHEGRVVDEHLPKARWLRGPRTMRPLHAFPVTSFLGAGGLPVRTAIPNTFLANEQIVPGLGLEGALLAAVETAAAIGRADGRATTFRSGSFGRSGR